MMVEQGHLAPFLEIQDVSEQFQACLFNQAVNY